MGLEFRQFYLLLVFCNYYITNTKKNCYCACTWFDIF